MKKLTDEQIQAMLDDHLQLPGASLTDPETQDDIEHYQLVFKALSTEPAAGLPFDFAAKVSRRLKLKLKRKSDIRFNLLVAGLFLISLIAAYGALMLVDAAAAAQFLQVILRFKFPLLIAVAVLIGSMVLDQRISEKERPAAAAATS